MKRDRRHQSGYVFRRGNFWYVRYYERVRGSDGTLSRVQRTHQLTRCEGNYKTKNAAKDLASEFLMPFNNRTYTEDSATPLGQYIEHQYLPYVESHREPSTYHGYRNVWRTYLEPRSTFMSMALREFRTVDGGRLLTDIAQSGDLTKATLSHIKHFLGGTFTHAKRQGFINSANPMHDVELPKARQGDETYAYSLGEIMRAIEILPEPASTIVAVAGFTALRKGEVRGLTWEDFDDRSIRVTRSIWRSQSKSPKTRASKAPVPVIPIVREKLEQWRAISGNPQEGWMFPNSVGNPRCLDDLAWDVIRPAFEKAGLSWHGWHAFRRGLATKLHQLGVQDKVIQAILRHANVSTTQKAYIKVVDSATEAAMQVLENASRTMHHLMPQLGQQTERKQ
jgi:integrase